MDEEKVDSNTIERYIDHMKDEAVRDLLFWLIKHPQNRKYVIQCAIEYEKMYSQPGDNVK